MVFFATRFLKQLEQNDKAPKQITSHYLSKQSSVLFKKDLPREFIPLPKGKSGREAMKWNISFYIETIINQNDELENKFSYQPYHLL